MASKKDPTADLDYTASIFAVIATTFCCTLFQDVLNTAISGIGQNAV